jgi:hypothetical protein
MMIFFPSSYKKYLLSLSAFLVQSCAHPSGTFQPSPLQDEEYAAVYQTETVSLDLQQDLGRVYKVTATRISPAMRQAMLQRSTRLFQTEHPTLLEKSAGVGFFLSIEAPDREEFELRNPKLWTIFLEMLSTRLSPDRVQKNNDKHVWQNYFPQITNWSQDYVLYFDTQELNSDSMSMSLILNHGKARTTLAWNLP